MFKDKKITKIERIETKHYSDGCKVVRKHVTHKDGDLELCVTSWFPLKMLKGRKFKVLNRVSGKVYGVGNK